MNDKSAPPEKILATPMQLGFDSPSPVELISAHCSVILHSTKPL